MKFNYGNMLGTPTFKKRKVFYTADTALDAGTGLCFDRDYSDSDVDGQATTDPCGLRDYRVELPSSSNNMRFAGVAVSDYSAKTGGQEIEIYEPGGCAFIKIGQDTTLNVTHLTCSADSVDAGRFTFQGIEGRGTAMALETDASGALFSSLTGAATAAYAGGVTTITATGIGTACGFGGTFTTGARLVVLGGADDATGGDAATGELATVGTYTILSAPTADTVTIADDIGDVDITCYVLTASDHRVLAYLYDGAESGLTEFVSPQDAVAVSAMVGGTSFICGGYTMAADSTFTLADGTVEGVKKAFVCLGALTTQDYLVTVTSGLQGDVSTALATMEFDAAADYAVLEWRGGLGGQSGGVWTVLSKAGVAFA